MREQVVAVTLTRSMSGGPAIAITAGGHEMHVNPSEARAFAQALINEARRAEIAVTQFNMPDEWMRIVLARWAWATHDWWPLMPRAGCDPEHVDRAQVVIMRRATTGAPGHGAQDEPATVARLAPRDARFTGLQLMALAATADVSVFV